MEVQDEKTRLLKEYEEEEEEDDDDDDDVDALASM